VNEKQESAMNVPSPAYSPSADALLATAADAACRMLVGDHSEASIMLEAPHCVIRITGSARTCDARQMSENYPGLKELILAQGSADAERIKAQGAAARDADNSSSMVAAALGLMAQSRKPEPETTTPDRR